MLRVSTIQESEREEIREALVRFLRAEAGEERLREGMQRDHGYDEALWRQLADMGLLGITVSEAYGGIGGSTIDAAMIAEELGRSLLPVPFIETCVMVPSLLESGDITEETQDILSAIVRGTATIAIGGNTALAPYRDPNSTLKLNSDGSVSGEVSLVMHGAHTDFLLLTFGSDAQTRCVLVSSDSGYDVDKQTANDPALRPATIKLNNTPCTALTGLRKDDLERARLRGVAALSALQTGAARAIFEITIDYLKTRYQFGRPIGSFQALKHIAADLFLEVESATSAAHAAANALASADSLAARSVALAGFICNDAFRDVSAQAIQLHGGIAYTREHVAHLYWRRARATLSMLGDSNTHREAYLNTWEAAA
jgi:alkylation response protein AidB-like acyl-CoA dehydrogenase